MRVKNSFFWFFCLAVLFSLASCKGDEGPLGPAGPDGPEGPEGPAGPNGAENCIDCHSNSQLITAKLFQWQHSVHATGGNYERNTTSCAPCHTSQGFLERIASGAQTTAETIQDPLPQNCYTCHQIHQTYTSDDWALNAAESVTLWKNGDIVDVGKGNLCIQCHQARVESPTLPDPATGATVNITNKRYGPHYGVPGMMFNGTGGYEVGTGYVNSTHTTLVANACVTCHMAAVQGGAEMGGHTFSVSNEDGDVNTAGCATCHTDSDELETKIADTQAEIDALFDELRAKLVDRGLLDDATDYAIVPQDFEGHEAGAFYNYKYVKYDHSRGVHNFKYTKTLLENSIAALN
jgi:formate-dependent nitrite reductase cytochrome c552 subunit